MLSSVVVIPCKDALACQLFSFKTSEAYLEEALVTEVGFNVGVCKGERFPIRNNVHILKR